MLAASDVSATVSKVTNPRSPARSRTARTALSRLFALFVLTLTLFAQQRVARAAHLAELAVSSGASERAERIESNALHVEVAVRVARAPFLARLPIVPPLLSGFRAPGWQRLLQVRAAHQERAQLGAHFHAKRRIPRMNSEEPPRRAS